LNQLNILIVDDNRDMADGLGGILEDEDYQVTLAYNGRDGIEAFNAGRFDVVTGCLFKPFRPENMLRAVERIMARQDGLPGRGDCLGI
jgi:DNA-binding NtrC family response regulator